MRNVRDSSEETYPSTLQNIRDVGGLRANSGRSVRPGRLYRSDAPLAGDSPPDLEAWPPRVVIDLRAPDEHMGALHPLASPETDVLAIPILGEGARTVPDRPAVDEHSLAAIYEELFAEADAIADAVRQIATRPGPVLVHCAAGKDRTGVVIAVTLAALGVERDAILTDYGLTEPNMDGVLRRLTARAPNAKQRARLKILHQERPAFFTAPAAVLTPILDALDASGGGERWLLDRGLLPDELEGLRARLLD